MNLKILKIVRSLTLLLVLSTAPGGAALAQEDGALGPDTWPTTLEAVVADIVSALGEEDKKYLREIERDDLIQFHHGWGTGIRNHFGLWRDNHALIESACGRPCHPDTASMIIIEKVWESVRD